MFDYTKEVVLNVVDTTLGTGNVVAYAADGTTAADGSNGDFLMIKKDGNYKHENLMKVYKAAGKRGSRTEVVFDITKFDNPGETYRVEFKVMSDKKLQEFASPNWAEFNAPILAEFVGGADAAATIANLTEALRLAGKDYFTITADTTGGSEKVTALLTEPYLWVAKDGVKVYDAEACIVDGCTGESGRGPELVADAASVLYSSFATGSEVFDDANLRDSEFATCNWLLQNYRLPTYANLRYNAANAEEMPSAPIYTQYVFKYCTPRFIGGTSVIGEGNVSYTNHVFYVPADGVADAAFEAQVLAVTGATAFVAPTDPDEANYDGVAEKTDA